MPRFKPHSKETKIKIAKALTKHGMKGTSFYKVWENMKARCNGKDERYYKNIKVPDEWLSFISFRDDMYKTYLVHLKKYGKKNTTLDRIDNNGNYCKENCRWATLKEQSNNQSSNYLVTYKGETKKISEWALILGVPHSTLYARVYLKWDIDRIFNQPFKMRKLSKTKSPTLKK